MRISERVKARITCPGCGSGDVEALMQPFVARTAKKSSLNRESDPLLAN
jgi:hypothetical protein